MSNLGINIKINGKQLAKAGFDNTNFVLTALTTLVHRKDGSEMFFFNMGGFDSDANDHVGWFDTTLELGDIISIEVIHGPFDSPTPREYITSKEDELKEKIEYFYELQEELKKHIKE